MFDTGGLFRYGVLTFRSDGNRFWVTFLHLIREYHRDLDLREVYCSLCCVKYSGMFPTERQSEYWEIGLVHNDERFFKHVVAKFESQRVRCEMLFQR